MPVSYRTAFASLMWCACLLSTANAATTKEVVNAYQTKQFELFERITPLTPSLVKVMGAVNDQKPFTLSADEQEKWAAISKDLEDFASVGHAGAQYMLGLINLHGIGIQKNACKGFLLLHDAASQGNASAAQELAALYYSGSSSVKQDRTLAVLWIREAAHYDPKLHALRDMAYGLADADTKTPESVKQWANWSPTAERNRVKAANCAGLID